MATYNLTITYPDAQQARILAALKARALEALPNNPDGSRPISATNAQAIAWLDTAFKAALLDNVRKYEADLAAQAAAAGVTPVTIT